MKAYIAGYRTKSDTEIEAESKLARQGNSVENLIVEFAPSPEKWTLNSRDMAEHHCKFLMGCGVHVGSHRCELAIEELTAGGFAIVCQSHPEPR